MNLELKNLFEKVYSNFYKFSLDNFFNFQKDLIWKKFESEKDSLLVYHLRSISERIKNIAKYSIGINMSSHKLL